jgi:hypothetical protein
MTAKAFGNHFERTAADLGHQGAQLQIREEEEKLSAAQRQGAQNPRIMMDFLGVR